MSSHQDSMTGLAVRHARVDCADEVARLYDICLRTGAGGQDATAMLADPRLLGDMFVGPYLEFAADLSWVLARPSELPVGYILGAADTTKFEATLEREWWPRLISRRCFGPVRARSPGSALIV